MDNKELMRIYQDTAVQQDIETGTPSEALDNDPQLQALSGGRKPSEVIAKPAAPASAAPSAAEEMMTVAPLDATADLIDSALYDTVASTASFLGAGDKDKLVEHLKAGVSMAYKSATETPLLEAIGKSLPGPVADVVSRLKGVGRDVVTGDTEVFEPQTVPAQVASELFQWTTAFALTPKGPETLGKNAKLAVDTARGAAADFLAYKADEERLSDTLIGLGGVWDNSLTRALEADDEDGYIEGRLKNVAEGGILGVLASTAGQAVKGIKRAKKLAREGNIEAAATELAAARKSVGDVLRENAEAFAPLRDAGTSLQKVKMAGEAVETAYAKSVKEAVAKIDPADFDDGLRRTLDELPDLQPKDPAQAKDLLTALQERVNVTKGAGKVRVSVETQVRAAEALNISRADLDRAIKRGEASSEYVIAVSEFARATAGRANEILGNLNVGNMTSAELDDALLAVTKHTEDARRLNSISSISGRTLNTVKQAKQELSPELKLRGLIDDEVIPTTTEGKRALVAQLQAAASKGKLREAMQRGPAQRYGNAITQFWQGSVLSGISTQTMNIAGTGVQSIKMIVDEAAAALVSLSPRVAPQNKVYFEQVAARSYGYIAAVTDGMKALAEALSDDVPNMITGGMKAKPNSLYSLFQRTVDRAFTRSDLPVQKYVSSEYLALGIHANALEMFLKHAFGIPEKKTLAFIAKSVDNVGKFPHAILQALRFVDGASSAFAQRGELYSKIVGDVMRGRPDGTQYTAKQLTERFQELQLDAGYMARLQPNLNDARARMTFSAELEGTAKAVDQAFEKINASFPVMNILMPFRATMFNMLKQGWLESNPVGGLLHRPFLDAVRNFNGKTATEEDMIIIGRYTAGLAVTGSVIMSVLQGGLTGAAPKDPEVRRAWLANGWRPYSIVKKIGEDEQGRPIVQSYSYRWAEPFATTIGFTADLLQGLNEGSYTYKERKVGNEAGLFTAWSSVANLLLEKGGMLNATNFLNALSDPDRYGEQYAGRVAGGFVPSIVKDAGVMASDILNGAEPVYQPDTREFWNQIRSRVPFLRDDVPVQRDLFGDKLPMDIGTFGLSSPTSYFFPIKTPDRQSSAGEREIYRLTHDGLDGPNGKERYLEVARAMPSRTLTLTGGYSYSLNAKQYEQLMENVRTTTIWNPFAQKQQSLKEHIDHLVTQDPLYRAAAARNDGFFMSDMIAQAFAPYTAAAAEKLRMEDPAIKAEMDKVKQFQFDKTSATIGNLNAQFGGQ